MKQIRRLRLPQALQAPPDFPENCSRSSTSQEKARCPRPEVSLSGKPPRQSVCFLQYYCPALSAKGRFSNCSFFYYTLIFCFERQNMCRKIRKSKRQVHAKIRLVLVNLTDSADRQFLAYFSFFIIIQIMNFFMIFKISNFRKINAVKRTII